MVGVDGERVDGGPPPRRRRPGWQRFLAGVLLPVLVGVAGAWLGLRAFGRHSVPMGPFRVQLASQFGRGVTDVALPPFGRLSADTHFGPLRLTATLQDVGVDQLTGLIREQSTEDIVAQIERDALRQLGPFALRVLAVGVAAGLVLAAVAFRERWRRVGIAGATALLAVGGGELAAWATFDPTAFRSPTYSGSLALAPPLIGPIQRATDRIDDIREELSRVVDGALRAYTSIEGSPLAGGPFVAVLHISDIHLSPLGMEFAREVAEGFDVDFVVDTGDLTSFGTPAERLVLSLIPRFGRPYVFVRGNHDSLALQSAMGRVAGAVVLDGTATVIEGITVYGLGHPVFTPDQRPPLDDETFDEMARSAAGRVADDLAGLPAPPDIVAVHDDRMVEELAGQAPLVISGHFHEASAREVEGTLFLRIGTTGGSGATVFASDEVVPFSAQILYLEPGEAGEPARLIGYDLIEQSPLTGSLTVERRLAGDDLPEPSPTGAPSPTESPAESPAPSPAGSPTGTPTAAAVPGRQEGPAPRGASPPELPAPV